jgi:chromosome partitioning protein
MKLDAIEKDLENKVNKDMILYMWLEDNYEHLELDRFDYILIDCHPDFSTATRNAIAISHSIISPIIPSEHGYNAKFII